MNIYKRLGFTENPFAYTNADDEEKLKEYFVPPPYFDAIIGDYNSPSSSIVLAPRGSGKTAQRKMIENWCKDKPVLAVTYDRFEFGSTQKLTDISLAYHLKNIITKTLLNIIIWAAEYPDTLKNLSQEDKRVLSILCHNYLGGLTGGDLDSIIHSLKSIPEKLKEKWNKKVGIFDSVVKFILQANNLPIIDLPELKQEEKKLAESYKFQMEILYRIATSLRFKAIYILIDKVDETEHTANNAEATYDLIAPLLKDLDTHSIKGYAFKYFLWDKIHSFYLKGGRPDRVAQYSLVWSRNNLLSMLKERLKAFSSKK